MYADEEGSAFTKMSDALQAESFQYLSIMAVIFSSLSLLSGRSILENEIILSLTYQLGVYLVLFALAVWATYRQQGQAYKRLLVVTILL